MKASSLPVTSASLLLGAALSMPALGATVLVNDPFTDGGRTNGTDPQDIAWWSVGSGSSLTVSVDPVTTSSALNNQMGGFTRFVGFFDGPGGSNTPQSLAVGDSIKLSADIRYVSVPGNVNNVFRMGLGNSQGTRQANDFFGSSPTFNDRVGDASYYVGLNFGAALPTVDAIYREVDTDGSPLAGPDVLPVGAFFDSALIDIAVHNVALTITRTASGVDIAYQFDNGTAITRTDTAQLTTAFDAIYFSKGNSATQFYVDNVNVTYTPIPEPGTAALAGGLAMAGLVARRRRSAGRAA
jgi:hypothetical protein